MLIDASAVRYAQKMLHKGYGYQNASRIAGVSEATLRSLTGAAIARPSETPHPKKRLPDAVTITPRDRTGAIIEAVARKHGIDAKAILGARRTKAIVDARWEAVWEVKKATGFSLLHLARIFNRDHTTILSSLRRYAEKNPDVRTEKATCVCPLCGKAP